MTISERAFRYVRVDALARRGMPELDCCLVGEQEHRDGRGPGCYLREGWPRASFEDIKREGDQIAKNTRVYFCVDTLGTCARAVASAGDLPAWSLLDMRPVISCNEVGVVLYIPLRRAKGRRQSLKKAMQCVEEFKASSLAARLPW